MTLRVTGRVVPFIPLVQEPSIRTVVKVHPCVTLIQSAPEATHVGASGTGLHRGRTSEGPPRTPSRTINCAIAINCSQAFSSHRWRACSSAFHHSLL